MNSMKTRDEQIREVLKAIHYSMTQAQKWGNDERREINNCERWSRAALALLDQPQPVAKCRGNNCETFDCEGCPARKQPVADGSRDGDSHVRTYSEKSWETEDAITHLVRRVGWVDGIDAENHIIYHFTHNEAAALITQAMREELGKAAERLRKVGCPIATAAGAGLVKPEHVPESCRRCADMHQNNYCTEVAAIMGKEGK